MKVWTCFGLSRSGSEFPDGLRLEQKQPNAPNDTADTQHEQTYRSLYFRITKAARPAAGNQPSSTDYQLIIHPDSDSASHVPHNNTDTSRKPRPGETDGKDYNFTERSKMTEMIAEGKFVEHAEFSGNIYGTSFTAVSTVLETKSVILDIDMQGGSGSITQFYSCSTK